MKSVPFDANIVIQRNSIGQFTRTINVILVDTVFSAICVCKYKYCASSEKAFVVEDLYGFC